MKKSQSTGPRSAEGKAASSKNALKTGIYAKAETVLPTEKQADLEILIAEYYQRFAPTTPEQRCLVDSLISDEWLLRRFRLIEAQQLRQVILGVYKPDEKLPIGDAYSRCDARLERLQRRINATRRNYRQALDQLTRLQAVPPPPLQPSEPPRQFVPSSPEPVPIAAPRRPPATPPASQAPSPVRQYPYDGPTSPDCPHPIRR